LKASGAYPNRLNLTWLQQLRKRPARSLLYVGLVVLAVFWLLPLVSVILTALKSEGEMYATTAWTLPHSPTLGNFLDAWQTVSRNFLNTILITVPSALLSVAIGSLSAYAIARLRPPGGQLIYLLIVASITIPFASIIPSLVRLMDNLHLLSTIPGLILVHTAHGQVIVIFLLTRFFVTIHEDIVDAARVDGCSLLGIYWRIILPLSSAALAATFILQFTWIWNDYFKALVIVPEQVNAPITVGMTLLAGQYAGKWHIRSAAAIIATLPTILIFLGFQRFFIRGVMVGAVKG
jgi:ABC-type glycerol-3-phosphate transport system permease component